jgi:Major intrinsic protein
MTPYFIGFTVAVLISLFAPLTQAGWNPARDFGPRLVACFAGWWSVAIPGPRFGFWVYIVGPFVGAPLGAALYTAVSWLTVSGDAATIESDASCLPIGSIRLQSSSGISAAESMCLLVDHSEEEEEEEG